MKITVAYNLRQENSEAQAELLMQKDVDRICEALSQLKNRVIPVEVSGSPNQVVERLLESAPDLIFNVAEGTIGSSREAFYPGLYEQLGIPFTGGNASLLHMNLDKQLAKTVVSARGIKVPRGLLISENNRESPIDLDYPLIIKPNSEGSSKGITQKSVVQDERSCRERINELLCEYPAGLIVEEFISGRELSIPLLESYPGKILQVVEHTFDLDRIGAKYNIYDYDMKQGGESAAGVNVLCPATLSSEEQEAVVAMARNVFSIMSCPDFGRVDIRLSEEGIPYFIELNPLPCLHPDASLMTSARSCGLSFKDTLRLIVRSAAKRYNLALRPHRKPNLEAGEPSTGRPTIRELGITVGRLHPGVANAITDVKGVKVGHITSIKDKVPVPGSKELTSIRTGVTAILPAPKEIYSNRLVAGGFILNGVGEMSGLTQVMEWGWLESPILLTNSLSVGKVHSGVVSYVSKKNPNMGTKTGVVLPVVGETDDSYLNDVRVGFNTSSDAIAAIEAAKSGHVEQGSIGAGTGMMTCDFAGGVGTSSRTLNDSEGGFTIGVLVLSNFGLMRNLTIDGAVVGRELDPLYPVEQRRQNNYGSVIVVVATDAPLLSSQLSRISRRAALGLGRVGSYAASTSGEIIIAFSTANRTPRTSIEPKKYLNLKFVADGFINLLYEAVIEATEEAVLNAIFCSNGMDGRKDHFSPALPTDKVLEILTQGRKIHASH